MNDGRPVFERFYRTERALEIQRRVRFARVRFASVDFALPFTFITTARLIKTKNQKPKIKNQTKNEPPAITRPILAVRPN
jgi:hypothetical protein